MRRKILLPCDYHFYPSSAISLHIFSGLISDRSWEIQVLVPVNMKPSAISKRISYAHATHLAVAFMTYRKIASQRRRR